MEHEIRHLGLFIMSCVVIGGMILLLWVFGKDVEDEDKNEKNGTAKSNQKQQ
jgi:hypothetical protein